MPIFNSISGNKGFGFSRKAPVPPAFTNASNAVMAAGPWTLNSFQLAADGFPAPTFSLYSGTLPSGLSLSSSGLLSGYIDSYQGGAYSFTLKASNGVGSDAYQSFSLTVSEGPNLDGGTVFGIESGKSKVFQPNPGYVYPSNISWNLSNHPTGVSINSSTGLISVSSSVAAGEYVLYVDAVTAYSASYAIYYLKVVNPTTTGYGYGGYTYSAYGNNITVFNQSGWFYTGNRTTFEIMMIGGGGAGGRGAGGGAAEMVLHTINLSENTWYPVSIGAGGTGGGDSYWGWPYMTDGSSTTFGGLTALKGGIGPCHGCNGNTGGSGSGGSFDGSWVHYGAAGTNSGVGLNGGLVTSGGNMLHPGGANAAAGGGGAGGQGGDTLSQSIAGVGGYGYESSITGYTRKYAGGGGGGIYYNGQVGVGGEGGGGDGAQGYNPSSPAGGSGEANTGSAGGGGSGGSLSGNGGSGIVVIKRPA
jgi:hypothetical protein